MDILFATPLVGLLVALVVFGLKPPVPNVCPFQPEKHWRP